AVAGVDALAGAIGHVNRYGTGHTEAICTRDLASARRFAAEVDAAAVVVNASTRFTDGEQFGFGGEIGISTQKLHARGPMGLRELTTCKYVVTGNGQVRSWWGKGGARPSPGGPGGGRWATWPTVPSPASCSLPTASTRRCWSRGRRAPVRPSWPSRWRPCRAPASSASSATRDSTRPRPSTSG